MAETSYSVPAYESGNTTGQAATVQATTAPTPRSIVVRDGGGVVPSSLEIIVSPSGNALTDKANVEAAMALGLASKLPVVLLPGATFYAPSSSWIVPPGDGLVLRSDPSQPALVLPDPTWLPVGNFDTTINTLIRAVSVIAGADTTTNAAAVYPGEASINTDASVLTPGHWTIRAVGAQCIPSADALVVQEELIVVKSGANPYQLDRTLANGYRLGAGLRAVSGLISNLTIEGISINTLGLGHGVHVQLDGVDRARVALVATQGATLSQVYVQSSRDVVVIPDSHGGGNCDVYLRAATDSQAIQGGRQNGPNRFATAGGVARACLWLEFGSSRNLFANLTLNSGVCGTSRRGGTANLFVNCISQDMLVDQKIATDPTLCVITGPNLGAGGGHEGGNTETGGGYGQPGVGNMYVNCVAENCVTSAPGGNNGYQAAWFFVDEEGLILDNPKTIYKSKDPTVSPYAWGMIFDDCPQATINNATFEGVDKPVQFWGGAPMAVVFNGLTNDQEGLFTEGVHPFITFGWIGPGSTFSAIFNGATIWDSGEPFLLLTDPSNGPIQASAIGKIRVNAFSYQASEATDGAALFVFNNTGAPVLAGGAYNLGSAIIGGQATPVLVPLTGAETTRAQIVCPVVDTADGFWCLCSVAGVMGEALVKAADAITWGDFVSLDGVNVPMTKGSGSLVGVAYGTKAAGPSALKVAIVRGAA
jgi:hypothetical protein